MPSSLPDDTGRWLRAQDLFAQLADLPEPERGARLALIGETDRELQALVAALLEADRSAGSVFESAVARAAVTALDSHASPASPGDHLGPWRLLRELGSGGMGSVYLAERADDAYRGKVAIKCLRSTLAASEMSRRFRRERQILADLAHPNIARLLDGGAAPDGTPYLVMEYIDGDPIDAWCERAAPRVRERIALFRQVCDAVQHAHRALIIHRDIKPANILVTHDGVPKLLDFGIAQLLDADHEVKGDVTLYQAMTPSYASPEQLRGQPLTTASDGYSLGVVLYRLLAGHPPHALDGLSLAEIAQRVSETLPPPPSFRAPPSLARQLRGDLDTIVLKALHPDPPLRYASVADLSEDLRRWMDGEPVAARRATASYRIGRFVRRHPVAVTASAAALLALAASTSVSVWQARAANRERVRAEQRQRVAEEATDFLVELFRLADPNVTSGASISARQMLDRGAERVVTGQVAEADVRATLATSLATIYRNLADFDAAAPLVDSSLAIRARVNGTNSPEYAAALHEHAELLFNNGAFDSSAAVHRRVLALQGVHRPGDQELTEASQYGLGVSLDELGQYEEAERHLRSALAMSRRLRGDTGLVVSQNVLGVAAVLRRQGRYAEAIPLLEESLQLATASVGRKHLDVAQSLNHLARTLSLAGRSAEAVAPVTESIAIQREIHGKAHPETAASLGNLAGILGDLGRYDEAERARTESLEMLRTVFGNEHPYIAATLNSLGDLMIRREDWRRAESVYGESLAMHRRTLAPGNPNIAMPLTGLGRARLALGRAREALPLLREGYALRTAGLPEGHWHVAASGTALGECLNALGRPAEAEPLLREAVSILERQFGAAEARPRRARAALARAVRALGREAEADSIANVAVAGAGDDAGANTPPR